MQRAILIFILLFFSGVIASALTQSELDEQNSGLEFWRKESMSKPTSDSDYSYLDRLASGLRKTSTPRVYQNPDRHEVYKLLQESIVQFPGYSYYYRDQLIKLYDDRLNMETDSAEYSSATAILQVAASNIYITMKSLPTKETVLALGDLFDYNKVDSRLIDSYSPAQPIPNIACNILNELPIKNRPYPKMVPHSPKLALAFPEMLSKWQQWCRDVKEGKIEPEFGPEVFADGSSIPPIAERHQIRSPKAVPMKIQPAVATNAPAESSPWLWVAGSLAVLASYAAWRMRKNAK